MSFSKFATQPFLAPFFDAGTVWNNRKELATPNTLASVGLGLRWQLSDRFSASIDYGIPLISVEEQGNSLQDQGIHFSVFYQPF